MTPPLQALGQGAHDPPTPGPSAGSQGPRSGRGPIEHSTRSTGAWGEAIHPPLQASVQGARGLGDGREASPCARPAPRAPPT